MTKDTCSIHSNHAQKYLAQLCKQFGQRVHVDKSVHRGRISFSFGECGLVAQEDRLELEIASPDREALSKLRSVVTSYVERYAFREAPQINWRSGIDSSSQATA